MAPRLLDRAMRRPSTAFVSPLPRDSGGRMRSSSPLRERRRPYPPSGGSARVGRVGRPQGRARQAAHHCDVEHEHGLATPISRNALPSILRVPLESEESVARDDLRRSWTHHLRCRFIQAGRFLSETATSTTLPRVVRSPPTVFSETRTMPRSTFWLHRGSRICSFPSALPATKTRPLEVSTDTVFGSLTVG